jgi:hypothetical protein
MPPLPSGETAAVPQVSARNCSHLPVSYPPPPPLVVRWDPRSMRTPSARTLLFGRQFGWERRPSRRYPSGGALQKERPGRMSSGSSILFAFVVSSASGSIQISRSWQSSPAPSHEREPFPSPPEGGQAAEGRRSSDANCSDAGDAAIQTAIATFGSEYRVHRRHGRGGTRDVSRPTWRAQPGSSRSKRPSSGIAADSNGEAVPGSSWSQTKRRSTTPVSIEACTPSTL